MKARHLVFLGPPASGKGTQGRRTAELFGLAYLSTGALLRGAQRDGTELGEKARPFLERGDYVPDEVMVPMVLEWVARQDEGWVLDGFPRTLPQARALDAALKDKPEALVLQVEDEELRRRVSSRLECVDCQRVAREGGDTRCSQCGGLLVARSDDTSGKFERRLIEYRRLVLPVIAYYEDGRRARLIDGNGSPDEVFGRLTGSFSLPLDHSRPSP
jgi:adenylate kinase